MVQGVVIKWYTAHPATSCYEFNFLSCNNQKFDKSKEDERLRMVKRMQNMTTDILVLPDDWLHFIISNTS
jgi:hypothetical protein